MNIVITGASRGLGKAVAEKFAAAGHSLLLSSRSEIPLYKTLEELMQRYPQASVKAKAFDISIKQQAQELGKWALAGGPVDILVNNAGSFIPGSVEDEPDNALEQMMNTNLFSAYHLTRVLLPAMKARKTGHIFNMCSIASMQAYKNGGAYSISKFALLGFTKNLRAELKEHGIKVTAVIPGAVYTDSWKGSGVAQERIMEAEDVAKMVFFATQLSPQAVVEDIVLRPQLGDL